MGKNYTKLKISSVVDIELVDVIREVSTVYQIGYICKFVENNTYHFYVQSARKNIRMTKRKVANACKKLSSSIIVDNFTTTVGLFLESAGSARKTGPRRKKKDLNPLGCESLSHLDQTHLVDIDIDFIFMFAEHLLYKNPKNCNIRGSTKDRYFRYFDGENWVKADKNDSFLELIYRNWQKKLVEFSEMMQSRELIESLDDIRTAERNDPIMFENAIVLKRGTLVMEKVSK